MARGNMCMKFAEVRICGSQDMHTERQTDTHIHTLIHIKQPESTCRSTAADVLKHGKWLIDGLLIYHNLRKIISWV